MHRRSVLFLLWLSTAATATAQGALQASLTAVAPIVVSGSGGAPVSFAAGPLTSAQVQGPSGTTDATFSCSLTNVGTACALQASAYTTFTNPPAWSATSADLLLVVTASPAAPTVAVQIELWAYADSVQPAAFEVDVGNDGTVEANMASAACCDTIRRWFTTADAAAAPLSIRVRDTAISSYGAQGFGVVVRVVEWATCATPIAAGCPGSVNTHPTSPTFYTNHQLAALPAPAPNLCQLHATGLGRFDAFVVSDQPSVLPVALPGPYVGLCDVLANVLLVVPGVASGAVGFSANPQFTDWSLTVPALPTGLVLHVQHLSATLGSPFWFGATNRLRIDT